MNALKQIQGICGEDSIGGKKIYRNDHQKKCRGEACLAFTRWIMKIALEAKKFTAKAQSKGRSPLTRRVAGPCTHILYEQPCFFEQNFPDLWR